ncbi:MAG TPA: hypothetical protein VGD01_17020 [Candidatus Elarobacter sp.]|jgi:hypothetical protein
MIRATWSLALVLALVATAPAQPGPADALVHHPSSTSSAAAQRCFDRGLTLFYAYNRAASQRAFACAAKADPAFAMAHWGIALAHGTNINVEVDAAGEKAAYAAIQRARSLQSTASDSERAYIAALATRYSGDAKPNLHALALAYKNAAAALAARYPDDSDAAVLAAESAMELRAWNWFTPAGIPAPGTPEIIASLESVLAREPMHIGANHLLIHMTESSLQPDRGLVSAGRLRGMRFEAGAAHLVHMPAHTYMRTGDFPAAAEVNEHASMHDLAYRHEAHEADLEASAYHDHNLTMLAAAYANEGDWHDAKRVAGLLIRDGAYVPAMFVYVRFARWEDALAMPQPKPDRNEPFRDGVWHFTRGMAFAGTGRMRAAQTELAAVRRARTTPVIQAVPGFFNSSQSIYAVASDVLAAKIARAHGDAHTAVALLRRAAAAQDGFLYIEPPDWYAPARESLGAALLAAGDPGAAGVAFREDLRRNPGNPRSLFGLSEALKAERSTQAAGARARFAASWAHADTTLTTAQL